MHRSAVKLLISILVLSSVFLPDPSTPGRTAGAQVLSVGITPSIVDFTLDPGESVARDLTISNEGDTPFNLTGEVTELPGVGSSRTAIPWLLLEPGPIELDLGDTDNVTVIVQAPETATVGGYFALLTFTT